MDEKLAAALARRLAAYSASAGVALAAAPEAGAQVVYHDFDPDLVVEGSWPPSTLPLDFDDDGTIDLEIWACTDDYSFCESLPRQRGRGAGLDRSYFTRIVALRVPEDADSRNGVLGYRTTFNTCVSRLGTGAAVGPAGPGQGFYRWATAAYSDYNYGPYCPFRGKEGYAGFRFVAADGHLHYGWLRLSIADLSEAATAYEYAYEAAPGTPIAAGAVSDVVLTGAVDQATFPPEGGTLRYTFTAENITNDPLPLDLWVDHYRIGHGPGGRRLIGSGTLLPRARVTRTVALPVPAGAPAGTYDVRFKAGDFASGQFLTFQRFEVTKTTAAPALDGSEGDLLAGVPAPGDLFAEAAAVGATGTHALSAPTPNPSSGQSTLELAVAEAQAVRVEVLDALGRRVAVLHDGPLAAGATHRLAFDGSGLPAGVYVVRAVGEAFADTRVLTLTR